MFLIFLLLGLPYDSRRTFENGQLKFESLKEGDAQVIQCNASNQHGYIWADVSLSILGKAAQVLYTLYLCVLSLNVTC